jgi:hypothetical protein
VSNKKCSKCKVIQPFEEFFKSKNKPDGLQPYCKDCCKSCTKKYKEENKDKLNAQCREYERLNKDKISAQRREYRRLNKEKIIQQKKYYVRNKRLTDPLFKLKENLRTRCKAAIRAAKINKSNGTLKLLGCTPGALKIYLEAKFIDGMSWDNQGKWHIDHIRPCASFDLTDPEQQRQCFHYTNLQPLWARDNMRKGAKWRHPVNYED